MQNELRHFSCRRAAVFSDIHSNYHAFRACYEDAKINGADCFLFLGDYVSDLSDPVKTLDLVYEIQAHYPTFCLRGNRERYMLDCESGTTCFSRGSKSGSLLYTFDRLRRKDLDFFRGLPIYDLISLNGVAFEIAHASKDDDRCYFEHSDERIQSIFSQMQCAYLLTGHSHKQYSQSCHGRTIINPGSVGVPQNGSSLSRYALLDIAEGSVQCRFRQVPYDLDAVIHAQFASGLADWAPHWAVSILYDVITGREHTMNLLNRVYQLAQGDEAAIHDENLWHRAASEMGMAFTERELREQFGLISSQLIT